jgi:hypothetical protein
MYLRVWGTTLRLLMRYHAHASAPGSFSFCTPHETSPIASSAPATTALSLAYRYLSMRGRPPSTSQRHTRPRLAVAEVLPWSRFLKIQCTAAAAAVAVAAAASLHRFCGSNCICSSSSAAPLNALRTCVAAALLACCRHQLVRPIAGIHECVDKCGRQILACTVQGSALRRPTICGTQQRQQKRGVKAGN